MYTIQHTPVDVAAMRHHTIPAPGQFSNAFGNGRRSSRMMAALQRRRLDHNP